MEHTENINAIRNTATGVSVTLDVYVFVEDGVFIAYSPALDLCGYGNTENEAKSSFDISVREYLSYGFSRKTLVKDLRAHGWKVKSIKQRRMSAPSFDVLVNNNDTFKDILENKEYRKLSEPMPFPAFV